MNKYYAGYLSDLFANDFMPHGHCYRWLPDVLWPNVIGDGFTVLAYFIIPFLLIMYVRKRPELEMRGIFLAFAAFIISCGVTHLLAIVSVWNPIYRAEGLAKVTTAIASMGTVGMLGYYFRDALKIPFPKQFRLVELKLKDEVIERQKAQIRAEHQRTQMEMLIKHTPAAVAMFDKDMRYLMASDRWYSDYGLDRNRRIIGRSHYEVFPEIEGMDDWKVIHQKCLQGTTVRRDQEKFTRANGDETYIRYEVRPWYDSDSEIGGIIMFTEVITEKVLAEKALQELNQRLEEKVAERTQELEKANEELESFSYTVSHDLRSPLRSIQGFAEVLEKHHGQELKQEGGRWLGIIRESAERMDDLIADLLDYSRAGKSTLNIKELDMDNLVNDVWQEVLAGYADRQVTFEKGDLGTINSDETSIYQVWTNLLSNALKYSSNKEKISIEVGCTDKGDHIEYFVKDNGSGFDQAHADKLFIAFQRLHTDDEFEGTGIGLATTQRIIDRLGGTIWAQGVIEEGAKFYFTLPKKTAYVR